MKNKTKVLIILGIAIFAIALIVSIFLISNTPSKLDLSGNEMLTLKDVDKIKDNADETFKNDETGETLYTINGDYENLNGTYKYTTNNKNEVTKITFETTEMNVRPIPYEYDENGEDTFDEEAIEEGYKKVDKDIQDLLKTDGYSVNHIIKVLNDGQVEDIDEIPSAKEMCEEFVNALNVAYYVVDLNTPDGNVSMTIKSTGWYSVYFSLLMPTTPSK